MSGVEEQQFDNGRHPAADSQPTKNGINLHKNEKR